MSGLGAVLNIAKDALFAQQYCIDVTGHNIANVNTEGYSRQAPILGAKRPAPYAGFILGRGVKIEEIIRKSDNFIETRLQERKTDLMALNEKEVYLNVLEGIFNENSDHSLSTQFTDFWNTWHDFANNPSGFSERNILYETGSVLALGFNDRANDMLLFDREINFSIEAGIEKINQLTSQIATLNEQIIALETNGTANDLLDQRNTLLSQLSEYIDINSFESDVGKLTVMTKSGYTLVDRANTYQLKFNNTEIKWEASGSSWLTITNTINGGKLGGWLDIRDEILPKYRADLDELARATIWEINKAHTQGVGLEGFNTVMGTYAVDPGNEGVALGSSGLAFQDFIVDDGTRSLKLWLYDGNGALVGGSPTTITIDAATTMNSLAATITAIDANLTSTVANSKLQITASNNYTFTFSDDTSNVLAALGINTFFTDSDAANMDINPILNTNKEFIAAACVDASTGEFAAGDNTNALTIANLQYEGLSIKRWVYERGSSPTSSDITDITLDNYLHYFVGSIGFQSQSTQRAKQYNEVIVNQLTETRNNISAVSLDEEMTNLIKYQHAYAAAARLISTADEMLRELLQIK